MTSATIRSLLRICVAVTLLGGCGAHAPTLSAQDTETLLAERDEWRGARDGLVWLHREVHLQVDTASQASKATSSMRFTGTLVRYAGSPAEDRERMMIRPPKGATAPLVYAWRLSDEAPSTPESPQAVTSGPRPDPTDPEQQATWLEFRALAPGEALHVVADFDIPGTLTADSRTLGVSEAPTAELLIRYDVPSNAVGSFQVLGAEASPLVADQDGRRVIALRLEQVAASQGAMPYARYVTRKATPRGYAQLFATSWTRALSECTAEFTGRSVTYRMGYQTPVTPRTDDPVAELTRWVRDRLQRADALESPWHAGRPLPPVITSNDLHGTDKIHLLHWLLEAAGITHHVALARAPGLPRIDPALPTRGAFDVPLIWIPDTDQWLDPACQECEPGTFRTGLSGQQVILLAAPNAQPSRLPTQ